MKAAADGGWLSEGEKRVEDPVDAAPGEKVEALSAGLPREYPSDRDDKYSL